VLRTALKPKWLGLLGVVVLVVIAFVQLGRWQLGVAHDKALAEQLAQAKARPVVELATVLRPHVPFPGELSGVPVRVTGRYAVDRQVLVPDRRLDDRTGWWVVTAFETDDGAVLPVLRGFTTDPAGLPAAPSEPLVLVGGLAPGESPAHDARPLPEGQLGSVDLGVLVNRWPGEFYNAFLFLATETTESATVLPPGAALARVPTPSGEVALNWRNASYAAQWWVFALFAVWLWWRMVRDDHRSRITDDGEGVGVGVGDAGDGDVRADPAARHTD
jgi:cytochrome oxidase assembly protein ShyY1